MMLKFIKKILNFIFKSKEVNYINGSEILLPPLDSKMEEHYLKLFFDGDWAGMFAPAIKWLTIKSSRSSKRLIICKAAADPAQWE